MRSNLLIYNNVQCILKISQNTLNVMDLDQYLTENTENQLRQYTDSQAVFAAHARAQAGAADVRGSMLWRTMRGVSYLIRTSASGAQRTPLLCLGSRDGGTKSSARERIFSFLSRSGTSMNRSASGRMCEAGQTLH